MITGYELARPDGWDFYTGKTIQYRAEKYPHTVKVPGANPALGVCSAGVGHASTKPNDCFVGARIPCSAFRLRFQPVDGKAEKWGWVEAEVLEEIQDLDKLFGWSYSEAIAPINPLLLPQRQPTPDDLGKLEEWVSVWDSVGDSVRNSVGDSVGDSVRVSVWDSVGVSVWVSLGVSVGDSVEDSVGDSVWDSVGDSVWAYIGSLFPNIKSWKYTKTQGEGYPFQPAVDLWKRGLISSYNGKVWRLHSGPKAEIMWQGQISGG